jgi:hypothetical protein
MSNDEIYKKLKRPFPKQAISWRVGATTGDKSKGIALAYIDARDVMNRFDEVFGLNWQDKYTHAGSKTICDIGVKIDGEWVWRAGGAGDTDIEAEKGAISDAFKRAAVLFGVGRYLYELPNVWVPLDDKKRIVTPPELPEWATPIGFDSGFTPHGNVFGEAKTRVYEGMVEELTGMFKNTDEGKLKTYQKWEEFLKEFKAERKYAIESQNFVWFALDSKIRSAIKFLQTQANYDERKAA